MVKQRWIFVLLWCLAACAPTPRETGILRGEVSIGPLVPVVGPGMVEPTPAPEVFALRKVVLFDASGKRELHQVDILADGTYSVELKVGTYIVDINHLGIDHAAGFPMEVEILANQILRLDIDIDTGIR